MVPLVVHWLSLLVLASVVCSVHARISCEAPCADASNSGFARAPVGGTALDDYVAIVDVAYG